MTVMVMVMLTTKIHKYQILDTHVLDRVKKKREKKEKENKKKKKKKKRRKKKANKVIKRNESRCNRVMEAL